MKRALILVESGYEEFEFWVPYYRLLEERIAVACVGPKAGALYAGKHGIEARADVSFSEADLKNAQAVIIPGGWAPDRLRTHPEAIALVKGAHERGIVIAAICHAGSLLVSADIVRGRRVTSYRSIRDDLRAAGAEWMDEPVVVDGNLITSRTPSDLPAFLPAILAAIQ
ncbi:MAG: type 1 glutamine amidotransferase [Candidatus Bipolaricaulis sp.]|nr:type 1 glutamine amidotransferase [Candidatus Bipolaricaulis sp.]MDD5645863.1 type 1 glutamine amidotransferase [Candidatus Bipolaricaulis sp.]